MTEPNATKPQKVKAIERRLFVLGLRRSGATYRDIAAQAIRTFGEDMLPKHYDHRYACDDVILELKRITAETQKHAEELRSQEIDRLDRMLLAIWGQVQSGSFGAIDRALRISERRAKFLGIDSPEKIDVSDVSEEKIVRLADELLAQRTVALGESTPSGGTTAEAGPDDDLA